MNRVIPGSVIGNRQVVRIWLMNSGMTEPRDAMTLP